MHKGKQLTKTQIKENLLYYQKILEEIILNNKKYNRPSTIKLRSKPYKPSNKKKSTTVYDEILIEQTNFISFILML